MGGETVKSSSLEGEDSRGASQKMSLWSSGRARTDSNGAFPVVTMVKGRVIFSVPFQYVR